MAKLKFKDGALGLEEKRTAPSKPGPPKGGAKKREDPRHQLNSCKWRGILFPISSMRMTLSQDLVEHKYWSVDGASVEPTGRAPVTIEATIPFFNNLAPGKNEHWDQLYPKTFIEFLQAFKDHTTGVLDTPEISGLTCKPVSCEFSHDPMKADGVEVTARWVETFNEDLQSDVNVRDFSSVQAEAINLDALVKDKSNGLPEPPDVSFEHLMNSLQGIVDTTASRFTLLVNKPAQVAYHMQRFRDSIRRAKNALTWPVEESIDKFEELAVDVGKLPEKVKSTFLPRKVSRMKVSQRMSLSQLSSITTNSIDDLLYLNPTLGSRPAVSAGTTIRYYISGLLTLSPLLR